MLDVGAGNGETPQLFFNHGAKRVLAIDPNAELLRENFPDAVYVSPEAKMVIVAWPIDFIKVDAEGAEKNLTVGKHFPSRWKTRLHGLETVDRLEEDWGGPARKLARLIARKVLLRLW